MLVDALQQHGRQRGVWLDLATEQTHGELDGLLGRLKDTSSEEWKSRAAWSWLSPLDVREIREGVAALDRLVGFQPEPKLAAQRGDIERLAALLDRYLDDGQVW